MNSLRKLIRTVPNKQKTLLGRWNIEYCEKKINTKVELANEDNCGSCTELIKTKKEQSEKEELEDYLKYLIL